MKKNEKKSEMYAYSKILAAISEMPRTSLSEDSHGNL